MGSPRQRGVAQESTGDVRLLMNKLSRWIGIWGGVWPLRGCPTIFYPG